MAGKNGQILILRRFQQNTVKAQQPPEFRVIHFDVMAVIRFQLRHGTNVTGRGSVPQDLMTLLAGDKTRQMVFQSPVCKTQFIGIAVDDVSDGMQTVQNIFGHDQAGLQASDIGARTDSAWLSVNFGILVIHLDPAPRLFEKNLL